LEGSAPVSPSLDGSEDRMYDPLTPSLMPGYSSSSPGSPLLLSRNTSYLGSQSLAEDWETPLDKLTFFDIFDNLTLPSRLEKWQASISKQREKFKQQRIEAKNKAVAEWRKRVPTSEEQLAKYRSRMKKSVDELGKTWSKTVTISAKEKVSFISAVLNVFISGYLIGAVPQHFYMWFTAQLLYFMPIRLITYHKRGYHYFLADLCYFVNALALLSIWAFPRSKRLFIGTYCLAYGNNAVAIVMWRNSLVFHSLDKVTSLFIHVMPPVTLHCLVHLTSPHIQRDRFPAIYNIKYSQPGDPGHYSLWAMLGFASVFYGVWQIGYHFLISVRKREKIAAGRPTSFTWLRRSYSRTWIGKFVLGLPNPLQEPAFMLIQYGYALLTLLPCPIWFWYRWCSATFLVVVFTWSIWNGANYYMDVFGNRFQKELELMKKDVAKWQNSPANMSMLSPPAIPVDGQVEDGSKGHNKRESIDKIPMLDEHKISESARSTGAQIMDDASTNGSVSERKG
jgi:Protein of unknown function (DUF2838)